MTSTGRWPCQGPGLGEYTALMPTVVRLSLVLALSVACGGGKDKKSTTPTGSDTPAEGEAKPAAVLHLSLEMEPLDTSPVTTRVEIVETNETGANERHAVGTFEGECKDATQNVRTTDPEVFLAFHCQPFEGQRGVLVHVMHRRGQLVLLRAWLGATKPTFDEFDQIGELPHFPTGVSLRTDFDK